MGNKIFTAILFHNKKLVLLYFLLLFASIYLILVQMDTYQKMPDTIEIPDIEIIGNTWKNEEFPYEEYEGINDALRQLKVINNENIITYTMRAQNIFTFSSPFYHVSYCLYGVEDKFFELLYANVTGGRTPSEEEREVLIGSNAAVHYNLKTGDLIDFALLEQTEGFQGSGKYIVSGILSGEDTYYSNGFYVMEKTLQYSQAGAENNMAYLYVSDKRAYKELKEHIMDMKSENVIGDYHDNYKRKGNERRKAFRNIVLTAFISFLVLVSLLLYIIKGMTQRAGILKALGIPDWYVIGIFGTGFGMFISGVCLFNIILGIYTRNIPLLDQAASVVLIGAVMFAVSFLCFIKAYKRILPSY